MKHFFFALMILAGLLARPAAAQEAATPVEYSERVTTENISQQVLQARVLDWAQSKFTFGPQTGLQSDPVAGTVRLNGTVLLKPLAANGKEQEVTAQFEFIFQSTDQGYTYSVGSFRVMPDKKTPTVLVPLDEYLTQLRADKAIERTKNDRRITAQANARANDVALSFRSYMNSMPSIEDGNVGIAASEQ
ncbi:DUF4468 domain-containing protein [Hymenobacter busanensis]|uniref:DUF4468 domain-containing protein n=1 Tax=Hymenobacter busanensis TaxID=2607656 RepID=A0A7L4ZWZ8_9BACT|nr:DUF4468 domain-containing protein [Hymenobacter busanensis]KAA9333298.1 DUF4468 domain-containing protein [Hymenobacter busanensis]QHJ08024.1 DUF4468 domain-containing protein [Hymenobacter busanensis]